MSLRPFRPWARAAGPASLTHPCWAPRGTRPGTAPWRAASPRPGPGWRSASQRPTPPPCQLPPSWCRGHLPRRPRERTGHGNFSHWPAELPVQPFRPVASYPIGRKKRQLPNHRARGLAADGRAHTRPASWGRGCAPPLRARSSLRAGLELWFGARHLFPLPRNGAIACCSVRQVDFLSVTLVCWKRHSYFSCTHVLSK